MGWLPLRFIYFVRNMKTTLLIFIICVAITVTAIAGGENKPEKPSLDEFEITVQDIPAVFARLKKASKG